MIREALLFFYLNVYIRQFGVNDVTVYNLVSLTFQLFL